MPEDNKRLVSTSALWLLTLSLLQGAQLTAMGAQEQYDGDQIAPEELALVKKDEAARIEAVERVYGSVVAIYGQTRQGGGSGVIYNAEGFALTNNHVVKPVGEKGQGGLADGKLYPLKLIGTDPGGDVAIVQLEGLKAFPYARLGDSRTVQVGEWCMAMGNPFVLAEDQSPTVTMGIVSGIERYQSGQGNEGVYGNCLQLDTSINPGNSGGPLFNIRGEVIGINGRGSFEERGRVNVGLGYAISLEQIKNFLSDLRAAKVCRHGSLDAIFGDREGKVVCEQINLDAPIAQFGLALGDRMLSFDGIPIQTANQFTNLISTFPEQWPVTVVIEKNGQPKTIHLRLKPLAYQAAPQPAPAGSPKGTPAIQVKPGEIRDLKLNRAECDRVLRRWRTFAFSGQEPHPDPTPTFQSKEEIWKDGQRTGLRTRLWNTKGHFRIQNLEGDQSAQGWNGETYWQKTPERKLTILKAGEALKTDVVIRQRIWVACLDSKAPASFKTLILQGGDKTRNERADRILVETKDGDKMIIWLSLFDTNGDFETRLLKMATEEEAKKDGTMWAFGDYRNVEGFQVPHRHSGVNGLEETVLIEFRTLSCAAVKDSKPEDFAAPEKEIE